jgi:hypothetical protein
MNIAQVNHIISHEFAPALSHAESMAMYDLMGQWCVCIRYGAFGAFPLWFAVEHDYHIVSITLY